MLLRSTAILFCALLFAAPAAAAPCGGDFGAFLAAMARDAETAGVSRRVVDSAFDATSDRLVALWDQLSAADRLGSASAGAP